jgi:hypothetical protein
MKVAIYPNPAARGYITVSAESLVASEFEIMIISIDGKLMKRSERRIFATGRYVLEVDTRDYSPGMYICKMISGNYTVEKKFIVF